MIYTGSLSKVMNEGFFKNTMKRLGNKYIKWTRKRNFPKGSTVAVGFENDNLYSLKYGSNPLHVLGNFLHSKFPKYVWIEEGRLVMDDKWYRDKASNGFELFVSVKHPDGKVINNLAGIGVICHWLSIPFGFAVNKKIIHRTNFDLFKIED